MDMLLPKVIFMIGFVASNVIRLPHQQQNQQNIITDDRKTPLEKGLLLLVFLGMIVLPLVYVFSPWLNFANYESPWWSTILGTLSFAIALWLFWRSHQDLGKNWSPTLQVREGHTLITNGIYQSIRHPMYTSIWLWCIAQALLLSNWIAGFAGIITFGIMYIIRIGNEEQMMLDQFGEEYRLYQQRTKRLIPYLY